VYEEQKSSNPVTFDFDNSDMFEIAKPQSDSGFGSAEFFQPAP